ncbi:MAG: hypothetical protein QXD48_02820 [Candidatus Aenigmatarchaeota archaeon]
MVKRKKAKTKKMRESILTRDEFYLGKHDEEKMLLFATGIVLGIGIGASILGAFWYGGIVAITVGLVLFFLEKRQQTKG